MKKDSHAGMLLILMAFFYYSCAITAAVSDSVWIKVAEGLSIGEFTPAYIAKTGDSQIVIIKIDPKIYELKLLTASEYHHSNLTVKEWCNRHELIAAINAGMFQTDYRSNVGFMKNYQHINNSKISSKYLSVTAFNPKDASQPKFRIYDIDKTPIDTIIQNYHTVIQNLRLVKRPGLNRWSQNSKYWSEAALGEDKAGNILFIFSRSPYSMRELNKILINLPLDLECAQHLEGGPEASLYFSYKGKILELMGSYETGFNETDNNTSYWPIPNVVGIVKKVQ